MNRKNKLTAGCAVLFLAVFLAANAFNSGLRQPSETADAVSTQSPGRPEHGNPDMQTLQNGEPSSASDPAVHPDKNTNKNTLPSSRKDSQKSESTAGQPEPDAKKPDNQKSDNQNIRPGLPSKASANSYELPLMPDTSSPDSSQPTVSAEEPDTQQETVQTPPADTEETPKQQEMPDTPQAELELPFVPVQ